MLFYLFFLIVLSDFFFPPFMLYICTGNGAFPVLEVNLTNVDDVCLYCSEFLFCEGVRVVNCVCCTLIQSVLVGSSRCLVSTTTDLKAKKDK